MRLWILRIVLCLVLGAITTVAVAWGCAALIEVDVMSSKVYRGDWSLEQNWGVQRWDKLGTTVIRSDRIKGPNDPPFDDDFPEKLLPDWSELHTPLEEYLTDRCTWERRCEDARGWPARAVWCEAGYHLLADLVLIEDGGVSGGIPLARTPDAAAYGYDRALPFRPIWPGFVIDTLFYAPIWFGVFFGFASAKRFIHIRRGRCPRCGYDLRGNLVAGCSECGWQREEVAA